MITERAPAHSAAGLERRSAVSAIHFIPSCQPRAIAVDGANRVFIAEGTDDRIKVFAAGKLIDSFGGSGASHSRYSGITALALDENLLYVADSLNARVQILLVGP